MKVNLSHGWWDLCRKRHPEFVLLVPAPVSRVRSKTTDPDVFSKYFDLLLNTIKENDRSTKPYLSDSKSCVQEESGLAFIPLISPSIKSKVSKSTEAIAKEDSPSSMSNS